MTAEDKRDQARTALLDFKSQHPRSTEDVREGAEAWLADARQVSAIDVAGYIAGGGSLQHEHLHAAALAFVVDSDAFASWLMAAIDDGQLISRKKRNAELKRLEKELAAAETAIVREQLEADREAAEAKLAALERGEQA